jgi:hypothetical protein
MIDDEWRMKAKRFPLPFNLMLQAGGITGVSLKNTDGLVLRNRPYANGAAES